MLLQPHVNPSTALFLLEEASRMEVDRLADACLRVIAQHLSTLAKEPQFAELVRDSAAGVEKREDVDSVPLVDDLRFHLADIYGDGELSGTSLDPVQPRVSAGTATTSSEACSSCCQDS